MTPTEADRASRLAAITLGLVLPGDTLLYLLLPVYAASFGVSLPEAGLLLAANRLVRIAGYGWIGRAYGRFGARNTCLVASCGAVLSTASYAFCTGLWLLLAGRLIWGLSFAALNVANQALPTAVAEGAAARSGRARTIIPIGSALALIAGGPLAVAAGPRIVFAILAAVACVGPIVAARITAPREGVRSGGPRFEKPEPMSIWAFAHGFTLDGLFIFGLGLLAAQSFPHTAVIAAGLAMSLRYVTAAVVAPVSGRLGQRFGSRRVIVVATLGAAAALLVNTADSWLLWSGAVAVIVLKAIAEPLIAPMIAEAVPGPARVHALTRQATWRDIGAGTGPLVAGIAFPLLSPLAIYGMGALMLVATSLLLWRSPTTRSP